jgi:hypothetical protein
MKTLKYLFIAMAFSTVLGACKQDQYYLFNDVGRLQFGPEPARIYTASFNLADTLKRYTFYYEDAQTVQDTVFFDLYAIGGVSDVDRPFRLIQETITGQQNALPGVHYKAFDDQDLAGRYMIKAGTVYTRVPIVMLRDASLKQNTVVLKLRVSTNEHFLEGELSNVWRKVEFTDRLSQPAAWNASMTQYYVGKYSAVKHEFMIEATGQSWDQEFIALLMQDFALLGYWTGVLKIALIDYNNQNPNNLLLDEDGELVVFP